MADVADTNSAAIATLQYELRKLYAATGNLYPPVDATPPPPAVVPTPPTLKTIQIGAAWSRTWGGSSYYTTPSGTYTNSTYLYQGQAPENKIGMWRFDVGVAFNKKIVAADMYLANINIPNGSSVTAGFGTHGNMTAPVGKPGRINGFDVGWGRGEAKWFALPTWTYGGLSNGTIQGFTVGGNGASDSLSAFWQGVGQPAPPVLRLTYQT
jgi:hypothetical protein